MQWSYLTTCSNCREKYIGSGLLILNRDLESSNLILKLTKIVVVQQDMLIVNVSVLITNMLTWKYRLLDRCLMIINLVMRVCYGNKKNIGKRNLFTNLNGMKNMKRNILALSEYVLRKNIWFCFNSIAWVHFSHKTEEFLFWKSLKYFNIFW